MAAAADKAGGKAGDSVEGDSTDVSSIRQLHLPSREELQAQALMESCLVRTAMSGVMGGMAGVFFGMLFGSLEQPMNVEQMSTKQVLIQGAKTMGSKSYSMGKTFAVMGAIYAGSECMIEKARAKHDIVNAAGAGCVTGGLLAAAAGPSAACWGCAGFATFSVVIEKFMERYQD